MTTPQDSPRRRKQKARRTKQLDEWRLKKATAAGSTSKPAEKAASKKADKTAANVKKTEKAK